MSQELMKYAFRSKSYSGKTQDSREDLEDHLRINWRDIVNRDLQIMGLTWEEVETSAQDTQSWHQRVALCIGNAGWIKSSHQVKSNMLMSKKVVSCILPTGGLVLSGRPTAMLGTDVSRLPAQGCRTAFLLVLGKRTSAINSLSGRFLKTYLFGRWDLGALWLFVECIVTICLNCAFPNFLTYVLTCGSCD